MSNSKTIESTAARFLNGLPRASTEDRAAQRSSREEKHTVAQIRELIDSLPQPSQDELRNRPTARGKPFTLTD